MAKRITKPRISKADLRRMYREWAAEELDAILLIEALGSYLGEGGLPASGNGG